MDALLDELGAAARPRRRRIAILAGAAAAVIAGGVAIVAMRTSEPSCDLDAVAAPWDRGAIEAALSGRADRFTTGLDAYWRTWTATRLDACEATRVRHELSERVLDARNACLERARRELGELASLVVRDASVGDRAIEAIERVRDPAACTADSAAGPVSPEIDVASAQLAAGQAEAASAGVARVLATMPDTHTRAEALFIRGRSEIVLGKIDAGEATFAEALTAAEHAHADDLVASIWVEIVQATGSQQHRFEAATANMRAAEAAFARIDPGPAVLSRYAYVVGAMLLAHGDAEAARAQLDRALATHGGARTGELGLIHAAMCDADRQLRKLDSAREQCRLAVELIAAAYGRDHVRLGPTFNVWAAVEMADNHLEVAREKFGRAVAIYEARGMTSDRTYALALSNMGASWMRTGDYQRARPLFEHARDLFALHHPEHAQRVIPLQGLASVALEAGDPALAIRYYGEALVIIERVYGKESPQRSAALYNLSLAYKRLPDLVKADAALVEVIAISQLPGHEAWPMVASALDAQADLASARGDVANAISLRLRALSALDYADQPRTRAWIEQELAYSYRKAHDNAQALSHYERAVAYFGSDPSDPYILGASQFGLAQSLWDAGTDRKRARMLATAAMGNLAAASSGEHLKELRAEVVTWLAARGAK